MAELVDELPRRTAHAVFALLECGPTLPTAAEVMIYDEEALSVRATAAALREAQRKGLCVYVPGGEGYWTPTNLAHHYRSELEDRYLRDTEESHG